MRCSICIEEFNHPLVVKPIDEDLAKSWNLTQRQRARFNIREGYCCPNCEGNLRAQSLASALIMLYTKKDKSIKNINDVINYINFKNLKVAEINGCHKLHDKLKLIKNISYSEYGSKESTVKSEDIQRLSYDDDSFDLIIHSETLEHVPQPEIAISELRRVLKNEGVCIFTIPLIINRKTKKRAILDSNKKIKYLEGKAFHGYGRKDCLVYTEFGLDFINENYISIFQKNPKFFNYVLIISKYNKFISKRINKIDKLRERVGI